MKLDPAGTEAVEGAEAVVPASGLTPARPMMEAIGQVPGHWINGDRYVDHAVLLTEKTKELYALISHTNTMYGIFSCIWLIDVYGK